MAKKTKVFTQNEIIMQIGDFSRQHFSISEYYDFIKKYCNVDVVESGETLVKGYKNIVNIEKCFSVVDFCDGVLLKFVADLKLLDQKDIEKYKKIVTHSGKICNAMMKNYYDNLNNAVFVSQVRECSIAKSASANIESLTNLKNNLRAMNALNRIDAKEYKSALSDCNKKLLNEKATLEKHPYTPTVKFAGIYYNGLCSNKNKLEGYVKNLNNVKRQVKEVEKGGKETKN